MNNPKRKNVFTTIGPVLYIYVYVLVSKVSKLANMLICKEKMAADLANFAHLQSVEVFALARPCGGEMTTAQKKGIIHVPWWLWALKCWQGPLGLFSSSRILASMGQRAACQGENSSRGLFYAAEI